MDNKFKEEINWAIKFLKKYQIEVLEIILIDNNSSDNTYKELNNLKFENTNLLIFKNPKERSNYGDGFTKGFLESKNLYNLLDLLDGEIMYLQEE